jgi:hypothetical protein
MWNRLARGKCDPVSGRLSSFEIDTESGIVAGVKEQGIVQA